MDSINGHSEKNQPKKNKFEIEQAGEVKKINISELPWNEQERIRSYMKIMSDEEEPKLFIVNFNIKFSDVVDIPMDFLATMFKNALVDNEFETAKKYGEEIKKRGYCIDISNKFVTLKHKSLKKI